MNQTELHQLLQDYESVRPFLLDPNSPPTHENLIKAVGKLDQELKNGTIQHPPIILRKFIQSARCLSKWDDYFLQLLHGYWQQDPQAVQAMQQYLTPDPPEVFPEVPPESPQFYPPPFTPQVIYYDEPGSQSPGYSCNQQPARHGNPENIFQFVIGAFLFLAFLLLWLATAVPWWER